MRELMLDIVYVEVFSPIESKTHWNDSWLNQFYEKASSARNTARRFHSTFELISMKFLIFLLLITATVQFTEGASLLSTSYDFSTEKQAEVIEDKIFSG